MERNYIAFISYRHKPLDIAAARRIHRMIERYTIPRELRALRGGKKHLGIVFRDQDELAAASDLTEELRRALDHSEFLVVICTPDTPESHWVSEEIRYFLSNPRHSRRHVLAVLADGEPEQSFPAVLTWDEAEKRSVDPLAADFRSKRSGGRLNSRECRRLLAPMVGCSYDDLIQRERRRRTLQLTAGAAAALAVSIGFSSVLLLKNRQIDAQKQEVQLRESQLLAEKAADLYEDGRLYEAIDSAIQALPNPGDTTRTYYAPAESILMETTSVFSLNGAAYMTKTVVDQPTPIANLCFSRDSSRVVTIDSYGELRCFDTVYGASQWTAVVASDAYATTVPQLLTREPQGDLLCTSGDKLYSLSMSTGEILWERELMNDYFIYDRQRDRVACVEYHDDYSTEKKNLSLLILSAETGQIQESIPVGEADSSSSCLFTKLSDTQLPAGGAFSEDGRYFACAFLEDPYGAEKPSLCCFVADLEQETGGICLRQGLDVEYGCYPAGIEIQENDLYIVMGGPSLDAAAMVMRVDWREGIVRWQMCTPNELDSMLFILTTRSTFTIFDKTALAVAGGNGIYIIDLETGEIQGSVLFPDKITAFQEADGNTFAVCLSNGRYFIGWCNAFGFHFSSDSSAKSEINIGEHSYVKLFGDGIYHLIDNSTPEAIYMGFSVAVEDTVGSLAAVDVQSKNRLLIYQPIIRTQAIAYSNIDLPDVDRKNSSDTDLLFCPDGQLVVGPFIESIGADTCVYAVIDSTTHTVNRFIDAEVPSNIFESFNWILPNASGYIRQEEKGSLTVVRDGKRTVLAEKGKDNCSTAANVYLPDGSVLSAWANDRTMTLWQNGQQAVSCALPEKQVITPDMYSAKRLLNVGANGYVLVGAYEKDTPVAAGSLAIYNWEHNSWNSLSGEAIIPNLDAVAFAQKQPLLAFADSEKNLCVWDLNRAEVVRQIQTVINPDSIAFLGFALDDTHLMIKTQDSLLLIYDISTGELNYQEKFNNLSGKTMRVYEDQENQRLYLIDGDCDTDVNGICLDLRSWTKLGQGIGMLYFDERTGELYRLDSSYRASDPLKYAYIPSTEELIHLGQELLNGQ